MKAILLSVQPKWLEKILNGEKTVEIRKSMPKCELPVDVYLYCAKGTPLYTCGHLTFGQEVFDDVERHSDIDVKTQGHMTNVYGKPIYRLNGKVVAKFTLREVAIVKCSSDSFLEYSTETDEYATCLSFDELLDYCNGNDLYAWHISDLSIFDKPMELGEFYAYNKELEKRFEDGDDFCCHDATNEYGEPLTNCPADDLSFCYRCWEEWSGWCKKLARPPQSWQYVEVAE